MEIAFDIVLALVLVGFTIGGWSRGLFAGLGALLGLVAGAAAATALIPHLDVVGGNRAMRVPIELAVIGILLLAGMAVGAWLGEVVRRPLDDSRLRVLEQLGGALLGLALGALAVMLAGMVATSIGSPGLSSAVASSRVLHAVERAVPDPVGRELARLGTRLREDALPAIGGALMLPPPGPAPEPIDADDPQIAQASASVVRLTGPALACHRSSTGSGFLVAEDLVATNAHVVAGVDTVVIEAPGGQVVDGSVVYFDPEVDVALVEADLDAAPLPLTEPVDAGAATVVQGYPHGGPLTSESAQVLGRGPVLLSRADGEESGQLREVYRLDAQVAPGNSGGPVLTGEGRITGMIFARDDQTEGIAYALTSVQVREAVDALPADPLPVDVGPCA